MDESTRSEPNENKKVRRGQSKMKTLEDIEKLEGKQGTDYGPFKKIRRERKPPKVKVRSGNTTYGASKYGAKKGTIRPTEVTENSAPSPTLAEP